MKAKTDAISKYTSIEAKATAARAEAIKKADLLYKATETKARLDHDKIVKPSQIIIDAQTTVLRAAYKKRQEGMKKLDAKVAIYKPWVDGCL